MNSKICYLIFFCSVLCLQNGSEAQENSIDDGAFVECEYAQGSSYYCELNTTQTNFNKNITEIRGQHGIGRNDNDVEWLSIDDNVFPTFSSIFCKKFLKMRSIYIYYAELESMDEDSLSICQNLELLVLLGNNFRDLPENLLISNPKMTELSLPNNQLTTLPEKIFLNQKELTKLSLSKNLINFLPSHVFDPLEKLQELNLNNNQLQSINPEWFKNLHVLRLLRLPGNQISKIPSKCFASLNYLENLWLAENRIKILNPNSFLGLQNLETLALNENEISDLPAKVFVLLNNLRYLHLENNNLTTIHSDSFNDFNRLSSVSLKDNKINAIDEKLFDIMKVSAVNMANNTCIQLISEDRNETKIKDDLKKCFDNYEPRPAEASTCGKPIKAQGNIIGGSFIIRGSYPWIAALFEAGYGGTEAFFCGGTIVSSRKVVTAAHCIHEKKKAISKKANEIKVLLGVHDLNQQSEVGRVARDVQKIHMHPSWNVSSDRYDADIAVLVLRTEVTFGSSIQPICLMEYNLAMAKIKDAVVVGYGKSEDETKEHENIPKILDVPIHKNEVCFLENNLLAEFSSKRTFCGGTGNGTGVCRGDSGSGVVVNRDGIYFLRGIVSASLYKSNAPCNVNTYAIFTDVLKFVNWIEEILVPTAEQRLFNGLPIWD